MLALRAASLTMKLEGLRFAFILVTNSQTAVRSNARAKGVVLDDEANGTKIRERSAIFL